MEFKPMLAPPAEHINFPVLASVKIDGIRCCIHPELGPVTRRLKPIPNNYIRNKLNSIPELLYHDGELLTFHEDTRMKNFNAVQSDIMSEAGTPNFVYYAFDHFKNPSDTYSNRHQLIELSRPDWPYYKVITQILVNDQKELDDLETKALADGWEGLMLRSSGGRYKYGRSTAREGLLLKVVRRQRAEAVITNSYERMHNANEATLDELGYTKRSSHKDNKIGRGDLGGLCLLWDGCVGGEQIVTEGNGHVEFDCGTGFDDKQRADLWHLRDELIGKWVTFEFRGVGTNNRPRFPSFIGFRDPKDM